MKLCEKIEKALKAHYKNVIVHDERGDGHFIQVVCVDELFMGQSLLSKTRAINRAVEPWEHLVHAWSVKGFTPEEWDAIKDNFKFQSYKHYPKQ